MVKQRIISAAVSLGLLITAFPAAAQQYDRIEEFNCDFNDGSLKNVVREIATLGSFANQESYIGNQ